MINVSWKKSKSVSFSTILLFCWQSVFFLYGDPGNGSSKRVYIRGTFSKNKTTKSFSVMGSISEAEWSLWINISASDKYMLKTCGLDCLTVEYLLRHPLPGTLLKRSPAGLFQALLQTSHYSRRHSVAIDCHAMPVLSGGKFRLC